MVTVVLDYSKTQTLRSLKSSGIIFLSVMHIREWLPLNNLLQALVIRQTSWVCFKQHKIS